MEVDLSKMIKRNIPAFWQSDTNIRFAEVLMSGLGVSNEGMSELRAFAKAVLGYSSQRLSLETSLNNQFDEGQRRILVVNNKVKAVTYTFDSSEDPGDSLQPYTAGSGENLDSVSYTYGSEESIDLGGSAVGFAVLAPDTVDEALLRQWIERVVMIGIEYTIIFF